MNSRSNNLSLDKLLYRFEVKMVHIPDRLQLVLDFLVLSLSAPAAYPPNTCR
jgi:hypothetical protein